MFPSFHYTLVKTWVGTDSKSPEAEYPLADSQNLLEAETLLVECEILSCIDTAEVEGIDEGLAFSCICDFGDFRILRTDAVGQDNNIVDLEGWFNDIVVYGCIGVCHGVWKLQIY